MPRPTVNVAAVVPRTEAEGPGVRYALWVQGCTLRCPGCCNPEMFDAAGGEARDPLDLAAEAVAAGVEGVSLLGGEPTEQARPLAELAAAVRGAGLSVMLYSGFTLEELRARPDPAVAALLARVDLLVDGRFDALQLSTSRRWVGSANQRLHFLTDFYRPEDPRFAGPNTLEIRLSGGALTVNGWPTHGARTGANLLDFPSRRAEGPAGAAQGGDP